MLLLLIAGVLLAHVALAFVLGRAAAIRGFLIETGLLFAVALYSALAADSALGRAATPEDSIGLVGLIGAAAPILAASYVAGVALRAVLRLPRTGLLWRVTRAP